MKRIRTGSLIPVLMALGACGAGQDGAPPSEATVDGCRIVQRTLPLPEGLGEASGAAWSPSRHGAFWSHNDSGGQAELFLVAVEGGTSSRVEVTGVSMDDWEDLALTRCPEGNCLVVGDIGDNDRRHAEPIALYTLPEPGDGVTRMAATRTSRAVFPDGESRDAEALFALPDGRVYLITKGSEGPVELYRWPADTDSVGTLELVRELAPEPEQTGDRVTGASASPDGRHVAVRSYGMLTIYRTDQLLAGGEPVQRIDLALLGEGQGEGVALADDGTVVLVTESGSKHVPGSASVLHCPLL